MKETLGSGAVKETLGLGAMKEMLGSGAVKETLTVGGDVRDMPVERSVSIPIEEKRIGRLGL